MHVNLAVEYQKRQEAVNKEVKSRLEYQFHLQLERFQRRFEQELLVDWLNKQVVSSITSRARKSYCQSVYLHSQIDS